MEKILTTEEIEIKNLLFKLIKKSVDNSKIYKKENGMPYVDFYFGENNDIQLKMDVQTGLSSHENISSISYTILNCELMVTEQEKESKFMYPKHEKLSYSGDAVSTIKLLNQLNKDYENCIYSIKEHIEKIILEDSWKQVEKQYQMTT